MTGTGGATRPPKPPVNCGVPDPSVPQTVGEPIAVAFDGSGQIVVQSREPAMLALPGTNNTIPLSPVSRKDTGHLIFHSNAGGFLACASCHAEGNDDGRVWNFTCQGARRTQSLQAGGLRGSEPFHWDGLETDMTRLMTDVFQGRMSGPVLAAEQIDGLMTWIDGQPRVAACRADGCGRGRARASAVQRSHARGVRVVPLGRDVHATTRRSTSARAAPSRFRRWSASAAAGRSCTTAARRRWRDRFSNTACGGANHGKISGLSSNEIADMITYLQSI